MSDEIDTLSGGNIAGSLDGYGIGASINGALPELVSKYRQLSDNAGDMGITFHIADFGGLRTQADTTLILSYRDTDWQKAVARDPSLAKRTTKEDWRKIAQWGSSMHNYGSAFDVVIDETPSGMTKAAALRSVQVLARNIGLVPGVDFGDPPHFELAGGLSRAKVAWQQFSGSKFFTGFSTTETVSMLAIVAIVVVIIFLLRR